MWMIFKVDQPKFCI